MQIYKPNVQDMLFQLEAFGYDRVCALEPFAAFDPDTAKMLLEQGAALAADVMLPTNRSGDQEGLKWDPKTGDVTTPSGFKEVYAKMVESGFVGLHAPPEYGGGGAPLSIATFFSEMQIAGNKSLSMCPGLTAGIIEALCDHGSDDLKQTYLPKLATGQWSGTMCLTEPQCGTDLGLVRTKAVPFDDHYKLTGTKIWITFGDHDLTENIVHLVLARLPDAPAGIKGISTFVVPKITLDGRRNPVKCTGLEHKMGIHASPTCVIDLEDAEGWLVGEPHRGMRAMFTMMNTARLQVGVEGIALGDIAYQTALAYAKDRRQSRSLDPSKREADQPADNILVHPDVRRMLLNIKATNEGMRGLATWVSTLIDLSLEHPDETVREHCDDLVQLLTPVVKGYCTERGFLNTSEAMQVCGGAGYTTDWSIEQYVRDARIAMIYEGTNHIQALDLVGRKLVRHGGRFFQGFAKEVGELVAAASEHAQVKPLAEQLAAALGKLTDVSMAMGGKAMTDPEEAGAAASNYLNVFGLVAIGYSWVRQATHAVQTQGPQTASKLKTANYFFAMILPEMDSLIGIIGAGKEHMMAFEVDEL